jgi:hypothetical protein
MGDAGVKNEKDKVIRNGLTHQKLALSSYANTASNQI